MVFELSSPLLNEVGLTAATSQLLSEQIGKKYGLETELIDNSKTMVQDQEMKALLASNIPEFLDNVIKHSFANKVSIRFEETKNTLITTVQDNGIDFVFDRAMDMAEP